MHPSYLVFDIETVPNEAFINEAVYKGAYSLDDEPTGPSTQLTIDLAAKKGIPEEQVFFGTQYHLPIAVCALEVEAHTQRVLGLHRFIGSTSAVEFLTLYASSGGCLVSWNGRSFDLPVLEWRAFCEGFAGINTYFGAGTGTPRNRYAHGKALDLCDWMANYGASRSISLNDAAIAVGSKGKCLTGLNGSKVYEAYLEGRIDSIVDYCCIDVFDTYLVLLRVLLLQGKLTVKDEWRARVEFFEFIAQAAASNRIDIFKAYIEAP